MFRKKIVPTYELYLKKDTGKNVGRRSQLSFCFSCKDKPRSRCKHSSDKGKKINSPEDVFSF